MVETQPNTDAPDAIAHPITNGALRDADLAALSPRHRAALQQLEQGYARATSTDGFRQYLAVLSHLYSYSPRNVMLIFSQNPDATLVNSFDRWQDAGRRVRRGEQGITIFYPQHRFVAVENETTGEPETRKILTGFGIGHVFDLSQTDGDPIAPPQPPAERFGTTEVAVFLDRKAASFAIGAGLRLEKKPIPKVRGYYDPETKTIALNEQLPDDDGKLKTLVHELAHYLAGDTAGWNGRSLRELIAEGTAYATLQAFAVDTGDYSFAYLKWFTREPGALKIAMPQIALQTKRLIAAIEGERPDEVGEWL